MDDVIYVLSLISALGSGLVAGWFFAFSNHIMKALGRLPDPHGMRAMQDINVIVINPWTMGALLGTAVTCIADSVLSVVDWDEPEVFYVLAGTAFYLVGTVFVTIAFNVPRNDALAAVDPDTAAGAELWRSYIREWTAWNHVRTVAPFVASALFVIAIGVD